MSNEKIIVLLDKHDAVKQAVANYNASIFPHTHLPAMVSAMNELISELVQVVADQNAEINQLKGL